MHNKMILQTIFIVIITIFIVVVVVRLQLKSSIESNTVWIVYLTYVYIDFFYLCVMIINIRTFIVYYYFFYNLYIFIHLFTLNYLLPSLLCSQLERRRKPSRDTKENQQRWRKGHGEWGGVANYSPHRCFMGPPRDWACGVGGWRVLSSRSKWVLWRWN